MPIAPQAVPVEARPGTVVATESSRSGCVALLAIGGFVALIGGIAAVGYWSESGVRTFITHEPCRAAVNDDGIQDFISVGMVGDEQHVFAIDAVTGSTLWTGDLMASGSELFCGDATTVVIGRADFTVAGIDVRTGEQRWAKRLADKLTAVAVASAGGCAAGVLSDQSRVGLVLATGATTDCEGAVIPDRALDEQRHAAWWTAQSGGVTYTISMRPQGTPILTVTATDSAGVQRWATTLEAQAFDSDDGGFVGLTGNRLIAVGAGVTDSDRFVMTALDPASGRVIQRVEETEEESTWHDADNSAWVALEGTRLYTHGFVAIACYDATTFERTWYVGM